MLCEKCGIANPQNTGVCCGCGAPMPPRSMCAGFADILSYDSSPAVLSAPPAVQSVPPMPAVNPGYYPEPMGYGRPLENRGSFIDRNSRTLLGALAAACALLLVFLAISLIGRAADAARIHELTVLLSNTDAFENEKDIRPIEPGVVTDSDLNKPNSPSDAAPGDDGTEEEKSTSGEGNAPAPTTSSKPSAAPSEPAEPSVTTPSTTPTDFTILP